MIYYDTSFINYHNPEFGSLECGQRVNIDLQWYRNNGYTIITPKFRQIYLDFLNKLHKNNLVLQYLATEPFNKNLFQKIFNIQTPNTTDRNCHRCTMYMTENVCTFCSTKIDDSRFFKYAHLLDKNIPDSDTTYFTHTSYLAIRNAVSLVCQMVGSKKNGFAIIRPPGHHASMNRSGGFCLVNNIAIAALYALSLGYNKIFIFDFDAHHGNGTQDIFYDKSSVYYCSIHTLIAYPQTGKEDELGIGNGYGYNTNITVPIGITTDEYLNIFEQRVLPIIKSYGPDLILVSAGFDGLVTDPMSIMKLTPKCYSEMTKSLTATNVPVMMVLEGGYDLAHIDECIRLCAIELGK